MRSKISLILIVAIGLFPPASLSQSARLDTLANRIFAVEHQQDSLKAHVRNIETLDERSKQMVESSQKELDRSVDITNRAVNFVGILATIAALIVAIGAATGFLQFRGLRDRMVAGLQDFEKKKKEFEEKTEGVEKLVKDMVPRVVEAEALQRISKTFDC